MYVYGVRIVDREINRRPLRRRRYARADERTDGREISFARARYQSAIES